MKYILYKMYFLYKKNNFMYYLYIKNKINKFIFLQPYFSILKRNKKIIEKLKLYSNSFRK